MVLNQFRIMRWALILIFMSFMVHPALATTVITGHPTITKGTIIHSNGTLWWVSWNYPYTSMQPCVFNKSYFTVGGIQWIINATGEVNISMNYYEPSNLYKVGEVAFDFVVTPKYPCYLGIKLVGVPYGKYVLVEKTSDGEKTLNITGSPISFRIYVTKPTECELMTVKYMGAPKITPKLIGVPTPTRKGSGFESIFAIIGLVSVTYLLGRNKRQNE